MKKTKFKDIMRRNTIVACEVDDTIAFVAELLEYQMDELIDKEPYAQRTIRALENAASLVWELQDYISELEDDEDEGED